MNHSTRVEEGFDFCGLVLPEIKISVFGGENGRKPGDSGYKPGYSGFVTLRGKTPGINPNTPEILDIPGLQN